MRYNVLGSNHAPVTGKKLRSVSIHIFLQIKEDQNLTNLKTCNRGKQKTRFHGTRSNRTFITTCIKKNVITAY